MPTGAALGEEEDRPDEGGEEEEDQGGDVEANADLHAVDAGLHLGVLAEVHGAEDACHGRPQDDHDPVPGEQQRDGAVLHEDGGQRERRRRHGRQRAHRHRVYLHSED